MKNQILIVGWDGADWEIIDDLIARGELPHVADMVRSGAWGTLHSTIPINSWAAWPTFLTGTGPGAWCLRPHRTPPDAPRHAGASLLDIDPCPDLPRALV